MSSPILSYKKSKSLEPSRPSSPAEGTRKVLSRRKALQEFYHIQEQSRNEESNKESNKHSSNESINESNTTNNNTIETNPTSNDTEDIFKDEKHLNNYIKSTPIEDILKLRNTITEKLNSHDLEKKSIIYDNYYELIRLNQTLQNVSRTGDQKSETFGIDDSSDIVDEDYILNTFNELKDFVDDKAKVFHQDFSQVVKSLQENYDVDDGKDVDSNASIRGFVPEERPVIELGDVDKEKLVKEIDSLILGKVKQEEIDDLVGKLDPKDEVLITQLRGMSR